MTDIDALLLARVATHGAFADVARVSQQLKAVMGSAPNWPHISDVRREALEAIATKIARMLCGDPSWPDHPQDGIGYLTLYAHDGGAE